MRPKEGARLKVFVVPRGEEDPETLKKSLLAFAKAHLSSVEVPGSFTFGRALPQTALGKACDWDIAKP